MGALDRFNMFYNTAVTRRLRLNLRFILRLNIQCDVVLTDNMDIMLSTLR